MNILNKIFQYLIVPFTILFGTPKKMKVTLDEEDSLKFQSFYSRYQVQMVIDTGRLVKNTLIGEKNKKCRFCGKGYPEVKFKKEAHIIPQSIGNRYLVSNFECDSCNQFFGSKYEESFANFFSDSRTFARIKNQNSGKKAKHSEKKTGFEIKQAESSIELYFDPKYPEVLELDPEKKKLTIIVTLPPHVPIHVFRIFVKISMCLIDEAEVAAFNSVFKWLMNTSKDDAFKNSDMFQMLITSVPGATLWSKPIIQLFTTKDKSNNRDHPEKIFILYFFNRIYQVMIPQNMNDKILNGRQTTLPIHPALLDIEYIKQFGKSVTTKLPMFSSEMVKDSKIQRTMTFEEMTAGEPTPNSSPDKTIKIWPQATNESD